MASVFEGMVYEFQTFGRDTKSSKPVRNVFYFRAGSSSNYGIPIAASSDGVLANSIWTDWVATVVPILSVNFATVGYRQRLIVGRRWPGPYIGVANMAFSPTVVSVFTSTPHGLITGDSVEFINVIDPAGFPATVTGVTVSGPSSFFFNGIFSPPYTGPALIQKIEGQQQFRYTFQVEAASSNAGGIAGEALPLFVTTDCRRLNAGIGKNFRSRFALSPHGESQQLDGKLTAGALTAITTATNTFCSNTYATGGAMDASMMAVSRALAMLQNVDFIQSESWAKAVSSCAPRANLGSQVSRKPRLTSTIA